MFATISNSFQKMFYSVSLNNDNNASIQAINSLKKSQCVNAISKVQALQNLQNNTQQKNNNFNSTNTDFVTYNKLGKNNSQNFGKIIDLFI